MGVGDLSVPKRMRAFGEAFYGRAAAYDLALVEGKEALAGALCRNILNGQSSEKARRLAAYAEEAITYLNDRQDQELLSPSWRFPLPIEEGASP